MKGRRVEKYNRSNKYNPKKPLKGTNAKRRSLKGKGGRWVKGLEVVDYIKQPRPESGTDPGAC